MDWEEEAGSSANFINTGKPSSILRLLRNREVLLFNRLLTN